MVHPRRAEEAIVTERGLGSQPRSVRLMRRRTSVARKARDVERRSTMTLRVGVLCSRMDAMRTTCLVSRQVAGRLTVLWHGGERDEGRASENEPVCVCVSARTMHPGCR